MKINSSSSAKQHSFKLTISSKAIKFLMLIMVLIAFFLGSCNMGKPDFEGTWKSDDGLKVVITRASDKLYDVKFYTVDRSESDNMVSGAFTYNSETKYLSKDAPHVVGNVNSIDKSFNFTLNDGKLYIDKGGTFFTKE